MMGFEPIPRFSRERILSPLRLPFRHIGAVLRDSTHGMHESKIRFHAEALNRLWGWDHSNLTRFEILA